MCAQTNHRKINVRHEANVHIFLNVMGAKAIGGNKKKEAQNE